MVNAFSFCIYGREQPKYHTGLLENIQLASVHFPDWHVVVYVGSETSATYIRTLEALPTVRVRLTGISGHRNSLYRFFAIDEPGVDLMMVRDADSRIHWKDRWAIHRFLESGKTAHLIRDHRDHSTAILAGLWGLRKGVIQRPLRDLVAEWVPEHAGSGDATDPLGFGIDQNFLKLVLYPQITSDALVHYSFNCLYAGEHAELFPFEWTDAVYCGQRVELPDPSSSSGDRIIPRQTPVRALEFLPKK
jgi:hypothetical protein